MPAKMIPLLDRLRDGEVLVGDGAMGTMLMDRGFKIGQCPELFNIEKPEAVEEIARLYLEAGAQIAETNTLGGTPLKLAQYELDDRTEQINIAAVQAARRAVGDQAYVSVSCGPTGHLLKPYGDTDPEEISAAFVRQLKAVFTESVDLVCVETMIDIEEAKLAVKASKELSPSTPVAATMTFDSTPKGFFTVMGVSVAQAAEGLAEAGADIVGSNCGNGIENMIRIAEGFKNHSSLPIMIQSNAGLPQIRDGQTVFGETPEFMTEKSRQLVDIGVSIIGGCCGTTPAHIEAIRRMVDSLNSR